MKFNPSTWIDQYTSEQLQDSTNLVYDKYGPIPFPKPGMFSLKLKKKISDLKLEKGKISNFSDFEKISNFSDFEVVPYTLDQTLFSIYKTHLPFDLDDFSFLEKKDDKNTYHIKCHHYSFDTQNDVSIFKQISDLIDQFYIPAKYFNVCLSVNVHSSLLSQYDIESFPSDKNELCTLLGLPKHEINYLDIDMCMSDLGSDFKTITIEKSLPF
jgi:hypothetical protein